MKQPIKVPSAGESVTQATIGQWQKKTGDNVRQNEALVLMETDKASMDLIAEHSGQLHILKQDGEDVQIGEVIGEIDTSVQAPTVAPPAQIDASASAPATTPPSLPSDQQLVENLKQKGPFASPLSSLPQPESPRAINEHLSPAVRKLVTENNLNPAQLNATGPKGRITKGDVLAFLSQPSDQQLVENLKQKGPFASPLSPLKDKKEVAQSPASTMPKNPLLASANEASSVSGPQQTRERMSTLRRRIAERLVESQQSTATLTTFNEIDMSQVISLRQQYKDMFQKKHQVKLGFMGFFIKSVVYALRAYPKVNAFIEGRDIIYNQACHIGVAVSTERGLVVPVIRHADQKNLAKLEQEVLFYAQKARDGKISPDDLTGGTFTISNGGVFGSLMSTPVLNPPQSGILGMHRIEQRPVAVDGKVVIKSMMYVALSYDHRMVDGRESVGFLLKIKECVEDPMRLMLSL